MELASALVVDDDVTARNQVKRYLSDLGVETVDCFESGEEAWEAIQARKEPYTLLVLDWKLPGLSGIALFNRIRRRKDYRETPLLVVSGLLQKHDFRLLQEFAVTALVEKPFTQALFENRVEELIAEAEWYEQNVELVDGLIGGGDVDGRKIESQIKDVLKRAPNPVPLAVLAARRLAAKKHEKAAEKVLRELLGRDDGCVAAMNELGKILHLKGRHREALDLLRGATRLSPQNMQRLCLLGEVELNLQDPEAARAYFDKALEIDDEDKKAQAGQVLARNMEEVLEPSAAAQVSQSFASVLNTIGIALVRTGQFDRGVEQYRSALAFVRQKEDAARVAFNLGLGYLRWGRPADALPWFQKSERWSPAGFAKSTGYVRRLTFQDLERAEEQPLPSGEAKGESAPTEDNVIPFPTAPSGTKTVPEAAEEETVGERVSIAVAPEGDDEPDMRDPDDAKETLML